MRTQAGIALLVVLFLCSGCGVQPPLVCSPGGEFPASTTRTAARTSSSSALTVSGTLVGADGRTLTGQPVLLDKQATAREWMGLFFAAPFVLADCMTTKVSGLCDNTLSVDTDATSAYRFAVTGEPADGEHTFQLYSALPGTGFPGASVSRLISPAGQNVELGELRFWDPGLDVSRTGDRLQVTAADDRCTAEEEIALVTETGESWFTVRNGKVEPELLDDSALAVQLVATVGDTRYASAPAPLNETRTPASRGVACTLGRSDGTTARESPCRLTDGRGGVSLDADVVSVLLEVPTAKSSRVGVRAYGNASVQVETSTDGSSWQLANGQLTSSGLTRAQAPGATARFVRLTPSRGATTLGRVFEVLVW